MLNYAIPTGSSKVPRPTTSPSSAWPTSGLRSMPLSTMPWVCGSRPLTCGPAAANQEHFNRHGNQTNIMILN